jgi:hypothetical protein
MLSVTTFLAMVALLMATATAESSQVQFELQLDDYPADTAWELRGPFPSIDVIAQRDYDYYETLQELVKESFQLERGGTYHLILTDYANNGIEKGRFQLSLSASAAADQIVLLQGDGNFGSGQVFTFDVPATSSITTTSSLFTSIARRLRQQY